MRALVYTGPQAVELQNVPVPEPKDGEVRVSVEAVGICGSDMHAYLGHDERRPAPLILGHEACGIADGGMFDGCRVAINPLVTCGRCDACLDGRANLCADREIISMPPRPGAFAEALTIPERNLVLVPDGLDPAHAALTEPVATAWHAVVLAERHAARAPAEGPAMVIGAGAVGLAAALILRARGCRDIMIADTNPGRRATAEAVGGLTVIDPMDGTALENVAAIVIDAVGGKPTRQTAIAAVRPGGVIVHVGLLDGADGVDVRRLTLQEIALVGCYTYTMVDFRASLTALSEGALGDLSWITQRPLDAGPAAFADLLAGREAAAKVVLTP